MAGSPTGHLPSRVIPAHKAREVLGQSSTIRRKEQNVRRARRDCLRQLERAHQDARKEGYEAGVCEAVRRSVQGLVTTEIRCRRAETQLVDLVVLVAERVLGELPPDIVVPRLAREALDQLRERPHRIVIDVHPDLADVTANELTNWCADDDSPVPIEVRADPSLDQLDCRFDLGGSIIDAGLPSQLAAIQSALRPPAERADAGGG